MNLKVLLSIGTIATGLICSGGNAQASDSVLDLTAAQPLEMAQSTGSG
ncbi:MAG: hypothetical protein ABIU05_03020 [Nitrospirales bacterium]